MTKIVLIGVGSAIGGMLVMAAVALAIFLVHRNRKQRQWDTRRRQRFLHRETVDFDRFFNRTPAGEAPQYELQNVPFSRGPAEDVPDYELLDSPPTEYSVVEEPDYDAPVYRATVMQRE